MNQITELTNKAIKPGRHGQEEHNASATSGLRMRTDLRAGLAWDDIDDQAQQLWSNLTSALSSLTGSTDATS